MFDDPALIKKKIKHIERSKKKSAKEWNERNDEVEKSIKERQDRRNKNLKERVKKKLDKRRERVGCVGGGERRQGGEYGGEGSNFSRLVSVSTQAAKRRPGFVKGSI